MNKVNFSELTEAELKIEKKKLEKRKVTNALLIGFLAAIVAVALISWILGSKKNPIALLLPMLFPIYFIYRISKKSEKDIALEAILKERNLK